MRCAMIGLALMSGVSGLEAQSPYEGVEFCVVRADTTAPFSYTGYSIRASSVSRRGRVIARSYPVVQCHDYADRDSPRPAKLQDAAVETRLNGAKESAGSLTGSEAKVVTILASRAGGFGRAVKNLTSAAVAHNASPSQAR